MRDNTTWFSPSLTQCKHENNHSNKNNEKFLDTDSPPSSVCEGRDHIDQNFFQRNEMWSATCSQVTARNSKKSFKENETGEDSQIKSPELDESKSLESKSWCSVDHSLMQAVRDLLHRTSHELHEVSSLSRSLSPTGCTGQNPRNRKCSLRGNKTREGNRENLCSADSWWRTERAHGVKRSTAWGHARRARLAQQGSPFSLGHSSGLSVCLEFTITTKIYLITEGLSWDVKWAGLVRIWSIKNR